MLDPFVVSGYPPFDGPVIGESSLSAVLGVSSLGVGLLESGLELSDLSGQAGVLQIQLVELAVGIGTSLLCLVQFV